MVVPLSALLGRNRELLVVLTACDDRGSRCFSSAFESSVLGAHRLCVTALSSSLATAHCGTRPSVHALVQEADALFIDMVRICSARRGGAPTRGGGHAFFALLRSSCFDVFGRGRCGGHPWGVRAALLRARDGSCRPGCTRVVVDQSRPAEPLQQCNGALSEPILTTGLFLTHTPVRGLPFSPLRLHPPHILRATPPPLLPWLLNHEPPDARRPCPQDGVALGRNGRPRQRTSR